MLDPPEPKTLFFARSLEDFTRFVFEAQKCLRQPRGPPKMAPESPVMAPDSTPRQTPIRVCTLKRFADLKPPRYLKVSLSAIRPYKRPFEGPLKEPFKGPYLPNKSRQRRKRTRMIRPPKRRTQWKNAFIANGASDAPCVAKVLVTPLLS